MYYIKVTLFIIILYLSVFISVYLYQRHLVFHPSKTLRLNPADWNVPEMKVVEITTDDNLKHHYWYKPAEKDKSTIVYFHGNAGHIGMRGLKQRPYIEEGMGVLLTTYRGYSGNPGKPSEKGTYIDARAAMQFLQSQDVPLEKIIIQGESLGSAIAVQMAMEYPAAALILVSPFDSMQAMGRKHYPFFPMHFLKDKYRSIDKIAHVHMPLLILHGEKDKLVPIEHGRLLFDTANEPKMMISYPNRTHSDMDAIQTDILEFIRKNVVR